MIRRLFWLALGLGFGLVLGLRVLRTVERVTESTDPGKVANRAGRAAGNLQSRLRTAAAEGASAARAQEAVLRDRFGVPTLGELVEEAGDGPDEWAG